jgi:hypothetical protein
VQPSIGRERQRIYLTGAAEPDFTLHFNHSPQKFALYSGLKLYAAYKRAEVQISYQ